MTRPIRILLVEDEACVASTFLHLIKRRLSKSCTAEIDTAMTLEAALQKLQDGRYDAIVTDLNLPDSQGAETVQALHEATPTTPIIAMSGVYEDGEGLDLAKVGACDFFLKGENIFQGLARRILYCVEQYRISRRRHRVSVARRVSALLEQVV